jgi:hypothetical protein
MSADGEHPLVEDSADGLGVRVKTAQPGAYDIRQDGDGRVKPANPNKRKGDGMSATPKDPREMHPARRPKWLGGENDLPLWRIDEAALEPGLRFRPDLGASPTHGVIEPEHEMTLVDYRTLLANTRTHWELVAEGSI